MPIAQNGNVEIDYETIGDPEDPPLLLIMGLGAQMISWDDELCQGLVDRGFFVIRFDNRDVGLSTKVRSSPRSTSRPPSAVASGEPRPRALPARRHGRRRRRRCSTRSGIDPAHVVRRVDGRHDRPGLAIRHRPERVVSLTSIMSTTGDPDVGQPHPEVLGGAHGPTGHRPRRDHRRWPSPWPAAGPSAAPSTSTRRGPAEMAGRAYDRCYYPAGVAHQLLAIMTSPSRSEGLRTSKAHAGHPRLGRPAGRPLGRRRTAEVVPGAELHGARGHGPRPARALLAHGHRSHHRPGRPLGRGGLTMASGTRWRACASCRDRRHRAGAVRGHDAGRHGRRRGPGRPGPVGQRRRPRRPAGRRVEPRPPLGGHRPEEPRRASRPCSTLVESADALIEGFRPGVTERLGFGPDVCLARNPRLVYGRMTGWGQDGPYAHAAGHDINYIALAGALDAHRPGRRERPCRRSTWWATSAAAACCWPSGWSARLVERRNSGQGQVVDAAMVDGAAVLMTMFHAFRAMGIWGDERGTNMLDTGAHFYDVYETARRQVRVDRLDRAAVLRRAARAAPAWTATSRCPASRTARSGRR